MSLARKLLQAVVDSLAPEKKEDNGKALMLRPNGQPISHNDAPLMLRPEPMAAPSRQGYAYPLHPQQHPAPLPLQHYAPPPAPAPVLPRRRRKIVVTETVIAWREEQ